ncbi:fumarylacetoacetate hydrolase family protein [Nitrospirillum sp. BR 11163]|uniref:fumarylacetoacetate hydrolase family protein n=1 Tax=Nitrospirillum sp. BR 11163 TaxID=3104323 RepID=UPI002AFED828|nr:fumarylacetoacetate hydrolase family protein [Nitrospirillum sp. BR 11163]MEA1672796.1 fumarylacetoacetate hydrolase family protein [Nitrospirillum sp. BR 11163]
MAEKPAYPPLRIDGTVYGVALNNRNEIACLATSFAAAPYKEPPQAPVLYVKPLNTHLAHGGVVSIPAEIPEIEPAAAIAIIFDRDTSRVSEADAMSHVAGYTLALDLSRPTDSYYRPPIVEKCRDGFLPIGPWLVPAGDIGDPLSLSVSLEVDSVAMGDLCLRDLARPVWRLIADISDFMTFRRGDVLLTGLTPPGARARVGSSISAVATGLGRLDCTIALEKSV